MNITRVYTHVNNEVIARGPVRFHYTACAWIPATRSVLHACSIPRTCVLPDILGILDLETNSLSSLIARNNCRNITSIVAHNGNAILCCSQGVTLLNLSESRCISLLNVHELSASSILGAAVHPDNTIWITTVSVLPFTHNHIYCYDYIFGTLSGIDLTLAIEQGLVQPRYMAWGFTGRFCYISCKSTSHIFMVEFDENRYACRCRRFSFLPFQETLVGLKLDPLGNIFASTAQKVYCWDKYGHLLNMLEVEEPIVDFAPSNSELLLLHERSWSKFDITLNIRAVPQRHLRDARI